MLAVLVVVSYIVETAAWVLSGWIVTALVAYYYAVYLSGSEHYLHYTGLADRTDGPNSEFIRRLVLMKTPLPRTIRNLKGKSGQMEVKKQEDDATKSINKLAPRKRSQERHWMDDPIHTQWVRKPTVYTELLEPRKKSQEVRAGDFVAGYYNGVFSWKEMLVASNRCCEPIIEHPMTYNMVWHQIEDENPTEWTIKGPKETPEGLQRVVVNTHPETIRQCAFDDWITWGRHDRGNKRFGSQATLYHRRTFQKDEAYVKECPSGSPTLSDDTIASIKKALSGGRPTKQDIANMPTITWPAPFTWKPKPAPIPEEIECLSRTDSSSSISTDSSDGPLTPPDSPVVLSRKARFASLFTKKPFPSQDSRKTQKQRLSFVVPSNRRNWRFSREVNPL